MSPARPLFNPRATVREVPLWDGRVALVMDDALVDPEALVAQATRASYEAPPYPYPGVVSELPAAQAGVVSDFFGSRLRARLGGRRTVDHVSRFSLVCTPPGALSPMQWQCHRDRVSDDDDGWLHAASVLYLFRDERLGGTSLYRPRRPAADVDRMIADSQRLDAASFAARHGVRPGYMAGTNDWFERVVAIPARFNRLVCYDGGLFHSADVDAPERLTDDPATGRLTLNSFFTCRRAAR